MDKWALLIATLLAAAAAVQGARYVRRGVRSPWTMVWMLLSFIAQMALLGMRGEMRGACPLGDLGEILIFSAWSLTIFYLLEGSVYRLSLLGVFTAPVVFVMLGLALIPGMMDADPVHIDHADAWGEAHAAFSVLAYGALGLAGVTGVMFLLLNQRLKDGELNNVLFKNLPPVRELSRVVIRLLVLGFAILTLGLVCGLVMEKSGDVTKHLVVAICQWVAYAVLLLVEWRRGMPPRKLALAAVVLFILSLSIFPLL